MRKKDTPPPPVKAQVILGVGGFAAMMLFLWLEKVSGGSAGKVFHVLAWPFAVLGAFGVWGLLTRGF